MKKIMSVFGTRPEAIKMSPIIKELEKRKGIKSIVCVTGQHKEMLKQVLDAFDITPDYDLKIMKSGQTLYDITINILDSIKSVLELEKPDLVLVHGDTTTTFATSLACFYLKIDVGHVEAGLRTNNLYSPFPEEFNRQAVSIISKYNFAPTLLSKKKLIKENHKEEKIYITGNTAIDALKTTIKTNYTHPLLDWVGDDKLVLLTAHRRENIGDPMRNIFKGIAKVLDEFPNIKIIYPIHQNPIVRSIANEIFNNNSSRIRLVEPLDVIDFHNIMAKSYLILTDSGGIQEEAPSLGIPVLVMRDTTERPEGLEAGTLRLIGTDEINIYSNFKELVENEHSYYLMSKSSNPYGDGNSSKRIVDIIIEEFETNECV